jgi:hypothetical protein
MLPAFLVPETIVRESGKSSELELPATGQPVLLTLGINRIIEQESLDVFIYGSKDGSEWGTKPLLRFPQKFYCGTYSMLLDLTQHPDVRFLRAEYKTNRWGRGEPQPLFGFYVFVEDGSGIATRNTNRAVA